MAKHDKLVGGNRVKAIKVSWTVEAEGITLTGTANDARSAALNASAARKTITDALKADEVIKETGDGPTIAKTESGETGLSDKTETKTRLGRSR